MSTLLFPNDNISLFLATSTVLLFTLLFATDYISFFLATLHLLYLWFTLLLGSVCLVWCLTLLPVALGPVFHPTLAGTVPNHLTATALSEPSFYDPFREVAVGTDMACATHVSVHLLPVFGLALV